MAAKLLGPIICALLGILFLILGISIWDVEDSPNRYILAGAGSFAFFVGIANIAKEIHNMKLREKLPKTEELVKPKIEEPIKNPIKTFAPLILFGIISAGSGVLIGSIQIARKINFDANGVSVTALVEQVTIHVPRPRRKEVNVSVVFYTENNEEIKTVFNTRYPTSIKADQELTIMYHKDNPNIVYAGGNIIIALILCGFFVIIGLAIMAAAIVAIVKQINKKKN